VSLVERIYSPTTADVQSGLNQKRYVERGTIAAVAAAQISFLGARVDVNQIRVIDCVSFTALPGAAQTCLGAEFRVSDPAGATTTWASVFVPASQPGAALRAFGSQTCELILMPQEQLFVIITFNAGVAANSGEVSAHGWGIPKGNVLA